MSNNPFKRRLADHLPAPRGSMKLTNRPLPTPAPDRATLQVIADRHTALRFGLSLPLASAINSLAGVGPREAR